MVVLNTVLSATALARDYNALICCSDTKFFDEFLILMEFPSETFGKSTRCLILGLLALRAMVAQFGLTANENRGVNKRII
jgi:hypothetical protein